MMGLGEWFTFPIWGWAIHTFSFVVGIVIGVILG